MIGENMDEKNRASGIKLIAVVNGFAAILHVIFWILAFLHLAKQPFVTHLADHVVLATTYGFGIADLIWSVTFLTVGSIGLWRMNQTGWLAAQFANVLYWYSLTVVLTRDLVSSTLSPGTVLFLPFAIFSIWAAYYLWKIRNQFL